MLSLLLTVVMASSEANQIQISSEDDFVVGVSIPTADHGWTAGLTYWSEQAIKNYPEVEWIIKGARAPSDQMSDLEDFRRQGIDALVIMPVDRGPLVQAVKKLHDDGVLVICIDRELSDDVTDIFIQNDNKSFGRKSAEYIVKKLGGSGNIVVLEGIPSTVNSDRVESAMKVFKTAPGVKILGQESGMWNRETAERVMTDLLSEHPKIDAIWASDDDMALGVERALREAGREDEVWILGGAGMKQIVKRVMDRDPLFPADVTYPPSLVAMGISIAMTTLTGGRDDVLKYMPKHIVFDVDIITPENAKDYYFPKSPY